MFITLDSTWSALDKQTLRNGAVFQFFIQCTRLLSLTRKKDLNNSA